VIPIAVEDESRDEGADGVIGEDETGTEGSTSGMSVLVIIGIVIALIVLVVILSAVVYLKRKREKMIRGDVGDHDTIPMVARPTAGHGQDVEDNPAQRMARIMQNNAGPREGNEITFS